MFDSHFLAFAGVAALLVLSPGATMVVVADAAIEEGRRAALWTVAGIGTANGTMALAAAFGLAAVVHRMPVVLRGMAIVGAAYLAWLGLRALSRVVGGEAAAGPRHAVLLEPLQRVSPVARFGRGLLTNYANASVVLFYAVLVPQFIPPGSAFLPRYLLLGGTHVAMSVVWQGAVGISVGLFAERMAQPGVRRGMDLAMGAALLAFALKIAVF
jgi:threonine/homoserine/homoserine lactone efflux protein